MLQARSLDYAAPLPLPVTRPPATRSIAATPHAALALDRHLLVDVDRAALARLAAASRCRRIPRGARVGRLGEGNGVAYFVTRGRIKVTMPSPLADEDLLLAVVHPGEWLGHIEALSGSGQAMYATAIEACEVVAVPIAEIEALWKSAPAIGRRLSEAACRNAATWMRCLSDSIFLELPARLVRRLLDLCRLTPDELQPGRRLDHGLSQGELAASIGVSRESVNKLLAAWKKDGWIDAGRGYVTVLRPSPLMRHASIAIACVATAGSVAARDVSRTNARAQFPL